MDNFKLQYLIRMLTEAITYTTVLYMHGQEFFDAARLAAVKVDCNTVLKEEEER